MANDKTEDKISKAKKIRAATQGLNEDTLRRLNKIREQAEIRFQDLGKTKLSILNRSLRRFNAHYSRLTNIEIIAPNDEERERLIQFNDTLPDMENTVNKVSILLENGIPALNAGTLESIGVFGVTETLGAEAKDKDAVQFERKRFSAFYPPIFSGLFVSGLFGFSGSFAIGNPFRALLDWLKPKPVQKKIPERNEDVENFRSLMTAMSSRAEQMNILLERLEEIFWGSLKEMIRVTQKRGYDCNNYSDDEEQIVFTAYKFAEAINCLLNISLQNDEGKLNDNEFEEAFRNGQTLLSTFD